MNSFYEHHKGIIRWHYRCFDRILLNGLIQPFQQPERVVGFFNTYRQLYPVSRNTLRGIADQFQHWLKGWTEKRRVPVLAAPHGRRDDFVDPYFKGASPDAVVAILKTREPARIICLVRSVPNVEPAPPSCCRLATAKPCSSISTRSQPKSPSERTPLSSSIRLDGMAPKPWWFRTT